MRVLMLPYLHCIDTCNDHLYLDRHKQTQHTERCLAPIAGLDHSAHLVPVHRRHGHAANPALASCHLHGLLAVRALLFPDAHSGDVPRARRRRRRRLCPHRRVETVRARRYPRTRGDPARAPATPHGVRVRPHGQRRVQHVFYDGHGVRLDGHLAHHDHLGIRSVCGDRHPRELPHGHHLVAGCHSRGRDPYLAALQQNVQDQALQVGPAGRRSLERSGRDQRRRPAPRGGVRFVHRQGL